MILRPIQLVFNPLCDIWSFNYDIPAQLMQLTVMHFSEFNLYLI